MLHLLNNVDSFAELGKLKVELFLSIGGDPLLALSESFFHRNLAATTKARFAKSREGRKKCTV